LKKLTNNLNKLCNHKTNEGYHILLPVRFISCPLCQRDLKGNNGLGAEKNTTINKRNLSRKFQALP